MYGWLFPDVNSKVLVLLSNWFLFLRNKYSVLKQSTLRPAGFRMCHLLPSSTTSAKDMSAAFRCLNNAIWHTYVGSTKRKHQVSHNGQGETDAVLTRHLFKALSSEVKVKKPIQSKKQRPSVSICWPPCSSAKTATAKGHEWLTSCSLLVN